MNPLTNAFFAGVLFFAAGSLGLARHFLLEPDIPNYPRAPRWLLHVYFMFAVVLIYTGMRYVCVWTTGEGNRIPPGASPTMVMISGSVAIYKAAMFANVLMQWYPAATWARINRMTAIIKASCPRRQ